MTEVARAVLRHPRVINQADATCDALVIALKDELLVRRVAGDEQAYEELSGRLNAVAVRSAALSENAAERLRPGDDVEVWRVENPDASGDAISLARTLRTEDEVQVEGHDSITVPSVSPNHVCVPCGFDMCPGGPPKLPPAGATVPIDPSARGEHVSVVVIDSGYIPVHPDLEARGRITAERGWWLDTDSVPGVWRESEPDDFDTYPDDTSAPPGRPRLPGIAGHGTFIAGIVAAGCPQADITVVGHRHEWQSTAPKDYIGLLRLFTSEFAIAYSVLTHPADDVISCGFAFPTLDAFGSIPFTLVMPHLDSGTAFVSPAGNEESTCPHWPAAHPRAIGVAATTADGSAKVGFSNWGSWLDCCSPGEDVLSTFGHVVALPQDYAATPTQPPWTYDYWATWSGTSFAAPRVAAVIASMAAADPTTTPRDHASALLGAASPVGFPPGPGQVDLPYVA